MPSVQQTIRATTLVCAVAALWLATASAPAARPARMAGRPSAPAAGAAASPGIVEAPATNPTTRPATQPGAPAGELLLDKAGMAGYGAEAYRLVNQRDEIVSVLKNGLTVIAKRIPSPVVSVRGYARAGGVYEGKWLGGGLSHLLEHLVAGGTNARRTEAENRDLLQRIGNNSNAYTTEDVTSFFVNTTADSMEPAVDLVTGWMLGANITRAEFEREREVVQRELEMGKGEPDRVLYYLAAENRYRVSPARVPVIGYQEVIQHLSRDDVYAYYQMAYQPNNLVFAVTGNLDPEAMLSAVQRHVADAPPGRAFSHDIAAEPPVLTARTLVATFPKLGEAKVLLGFPSVTLNSPDLYALDLLAAVLGQGESSLLVEEIRDGKELVSGIEVGDETPAYAPGTFAVQMEMPAEKMADATKAVLAAIEDVKKNGVDEQRLKRAKAQMKAARVKKLLTAEDVGESYALDFIGTGDPHFSDKYTDRMQRITNEQIKAVAVKYLNRNRLLTTALLPAEYVGSRGLPKAEDLLRPVVPTTQPGKAGKEPPDAPVARTVLDDGTVLLVKRISTSPIVTVQMYALGGLTAEDEKTNGLGNLAMELVPRGTATRNAQQIAEFFDSIGGEMDTKCGTNSWYWNATCLKDDFAPAMDVYADLVNHPTFPDAEVGPMKKRVAAAIAAQDADWTQQAFRFFKKTYFGPTGSPYQFLPVGTAQNVGGFTAAQVREWYQKKILTAPRVLAVYGDVEPGQVEKLARGYFGKGNKGEPQGGLTKTGTGTLLLPGQGDNAADKPDKAGKADVTVARVEVNKTEQELAGVVIGYRADGVVGEPATFPIDVADTMTSGYTYPTGYLFEVLRGRGLVYVVHAQNIPGLKASLPGSFMVYAGCDPKNVNEVVDLILENIARVQGTPADVNEDWFKRSKDLIVVAEALEHETPAAQAQQAALDELYGLGYGWHQQFADRIRAVTLPEVRDVARRRLRECVVTVSTPSPEKVKVKTGRRTYDAFPPVDLTPRGVQHDTGGGAK